MEPVVLDLGSGFIKAGYANPDNDPTLVFPSVLRKVDNGAGAAPNGKMTRDPRTVEPIERGLVRDWEALESMWRYIFYTNLGWEMGNEGQVLLAEPLGTSKMEREKLTQLLFEEFKCSGMFVAEQSLLALYAAGRLTGCTVDIGHGKIEVVPILDGAVQYAAAKRLDLGCQDLNQLMARHLAESNPHISINPAHVAGVREQICQVAEDADSYLQLAGSCPEEEHQLPDGQTIRVGRERYSVAETLFSPSLLGMEEEGLPSQLAACVAQCGPLETQRQMLEGLVFAGGGTRTAGFANRFLRDAAQVSLPSMPPTLVKTPEYMPDNSDLYATWLGGAIVAKVVFAQNQHVTKTDYDEFGPPIIHRKCF